MKKIKTMRLLTVFSVITLIIALVFTGAVLAKYVFSKDLGSFDLSVKPKIRVAESIGDIVGDNNLKRIVFDYWDGEQGYRDDSFGVTITDWKEEGSRLFDINDETVRMFMKEHQAGEYTVYVLSEEDYVAPQRSDKLFSPPDASSPLATTVEEIELRNFHFGPGTSANALFEGCNALRTLGLPGMDFDSIASTDMKKVLSGSAVTDLGLSGAKLSPQQLKAFFEPIKGKMLSLDISDAHITSNKWEKVFQNTSKLSSIKGFTTLDFSNVTTIEYMFENCKALDNDTFKEFGECLSNGNGITSLRSAFLDCTILNADAFYAIMNGLDEGNKGDNKIASLQQAFQNCRGIVGDIDLSALDFSDLTNIRETFYSCTSIRSVKFPEALNITLMFRLFYGCLNLSSVDMSKVSVEKVERLDGIFCDCRALEVVDISGFDTSRVTQMSLTEPLNKSYYGMFEKCYALKTVYVGEGWDTSGVTASTDMFKGCDAIVGGNGTTFDSEITDKTYARIDTDGAPGYLTPSWSVPGAAEFKTKMANNKISGTALTKIVFDYWDLESGYAAAGIAADQWSEGIDLDKTGLIKLFPKASGSETTMYILSEKNIQAPINSSYLFSGKGNMSGLTQSYGTMQEVKQIVFNNFHLPNGAFTADYMFYNCTALSSLDLSKWTESTLTSLSLNNAFQNCTALTSLDLSSFDAWSLEKLLLRSAFSGCSSLSSLDLSYLAKSTLKELDMNSAFSGCRSFTSMDLSSFAVDKTSLTNLDLRGAFNGCSSLVDLVLSGMDFTIHSDIFDNTSFSNLSSLKTLDLSDTVWWYGNITYIWNMKTVETVCLTGINTEQVNNMADVFNSWSNLREIIGIADLDTVNLKDMSETFKGCSSLEDKYFAEFAQALAKGNSVQNLAYAFSGCAKMSNESFNAIISALNTGNVTTVTGAFNGCTGLSGVLDMSAFDMTNVTDDRSTMFTGCTGVTSIIWPDTAAVQATARSVGENSGAIGSTNVPLNTCVDLTRIKELRAS